ncbi:Leukocyte receptor cluster member 8 [Lemmus lemmus]
MSHALALRAAWPPGIYYCFFQLYCHVPWMSRYLVDKFADQELKAALKVMIKPFCPALPIAYLQAQLAL